jgi:hypothetical protein
MSHPVDPGQEVSRLAILTAIQSCRQQGVPLTKALAYNGDDEYMQEIVKRFNDDAALCTVASVNVERVNSHLENAWIMRFEHIVAMNTWTNADVETRGEKPTLHANEPFKYLVLDDGSNLVAASKSDVHYVLPVQTRAVYTIPKRQPSRPIQPKPSSSSCTQTLTTSITAVQPATTIPQPGTSTPIVNVNEPGFRVEGDKNVCNICGVKISGKDIRNIQKHLRNSHSSNQNDKKECPMCNIIMAKRNLSRHIKTKHRSASQTAPVMEQVAVPEAGPEALP